MQLIKQWIVALHSILLRRKTICSALSNVQQQSQSEKSDFSFLKIASFTLTIIFFVMTTTRGIEIPPKWNSNSPVFRP